MSRVTMDVSDKMLDLIKDLQVRTGSETPAELIRKAVSVYRFLVEAYEAGESVEIHRKNGKVDGVRVIPDRVA
jgi:hypothetical protein